MGFWLFMLVSAMLIPATMLLFGLLFQTRPPQEINNLYGYRTARSMCNADTWRFAHVCCGKIWVRCGAAAAAVTARACACRFGRSVNLLFRRRAGLAPVAAAGRNHSAGGTPAEEDL